MRVPVEDEHPATRLGEPALAYPGRDGYVVEEAEAHGRVSRQPDHDKPLHTSPLTTTRLDGAAGRDEGGLERHARREGTLPAAVPRCVIPQDRDVVSAAAWL